MKWSEPPHPQNGLLLAVFPGCEDEKLSSAQLVVQAGYTGDP